MQFESSAKEYRDQTLARFESWFDRRSGIYYKKSVWTYEIQCFINIRIAL